MTDHFPGPVNADRAEEAERSRHALRDRFRAVSRRIDRRGGATRIACVGRGLSLSAFEILIGSGVVLFVLWAAGHLLGLA